MAIEYNFTLDMDRSKRDNNIAYARTGDMDSIVINADLVFGGAAYTPSGENAFFECITPNGRSIRSAAEKTGSSVTVEVPPAAFQAAGVINVAYFRFESGETGNPTYVESTEPFAIVVREGIGDSIDAGDYIEDWRKLVDHLEVVVADVGQKAEQVEIAKAAAEKAKADAETAGIAAANSASAAAGSAQDAQRSATAAASSAASVADKFISSAQATTLEPGSQATASVENQVLTIGVPKGEKGDTGEKGDPGVGVPEGGEPGQLLSKTDSGTAWVDPPSGNVLTGTATGYVAHAEDAYAQKPIEVRVKGRTVKNLWPVINNKQNGVAASTDGTGLVTVTGQLEVATTGAYLFTTLTNVVAGRSVTALCSRGLPDGVYLYVSFADEGGGLVGSELQVGFDSTSETQKTATVPSGTVSALAGVGVKRGTTLEGSLTFRVMLVEGTEAPDCFVPTGLHSVEPANLVTAGKNLFPTGSDDGWYKGGYSASRALIKRNNPVTLPYTSTSESFGVGNVFRAVAGQAYTLTVTGYPENFSTGLCWALYETLEDTGNPLKAFKWSIGGSAQKTMTTDVLPISGYLVVCVAGQWTDGSVNFGEYPAGMRIQCELGSTATAYEPPNITTTPLPEVELRGLPDGTCDELVIAQDGAATVERRTQLSGGEVMALPEPTTEQLSPVTLPVLPAPTFNQYHDSDVPSDTTVTYERDINVVIDNLAKQITGTAATVAINEATR